MQLAGKRALVTGGGKGIGRGITERFLAEGARVAVLQRGPLPDALAGDDRVRAVTVDLSDTASIAEAVENAAGLLDGIDVVVNNAGAMFERSVAEIRPEEWDRMVALNLRAPLFVVQAALPHLRAAGAGAIVNIGSVEGIAANPEHAAYCATKAGVHGLTRALAVDLGADGIRCNTVAPGWISTDLSERYLDSMPDPAAARRRLGELHPVGRTGRPADIGAACAFLASDAAAFITGEVLVVDGGRTIRLPNPADGSA